MTPVIRYEGDMKRLSIFGRATVALGLTAALLAGCDGGSDSDDKAAGPEGSAAVNDGHCRTGDLDLKTAAGGSDEDIQLVNLVFTNKSGKECTLSGHPAVSWVSADKIQINETFEREPGGSKAAVKLAPGAPAHAVLRFDSADNYDEKTCKPMKVTGLRVVPPGEHSAAGVALPETVCSIAGVSIAQVDQIAEGAGTTKKGAPADGDIGS